MEIDINDKQQYLIAIVKDLQRQYAQAVEPHIKRLSKIHEFKTKGYVVYEENLSKITDLVSKNVKGK